MIDDRNDSLSTRQFEGLGNWDRKADETEWGAQLGERLRTDDVSIYAAPARATDLSGLAPACIDVGSSETFRDESIEYARTLWRDGVPCEVHVWTGAYHAFGEVAPQSQLAVESADARIAWLRRLTALASVS